MLTAIVCSLILSSYRHFYIPPRSPEVGHALHPWLKAKARPMSLKLPAKREIGALPAKDIRRLRDLSRRRRQEAPLRDSPLFTSDSPEKQKAALDSVFAAIDAAARAGETPILIADLDGTVFTEGPHSQVIHGQKPLPGAVAFFNEALARGAAVIGATARSSWYHGATVRQLQDDGFKINGKRFQVLDERVPSHAPLKAEIQKLGGALPAIRKAFPRGRIIAAFENEVRVVRWYQRALPDAKIFRLNTHNTSKDPGELTGPEPKLVPSDGRLAEIVVIDHYAPRAARE